MSCFDLSSQGKYRYGSYNQAPANDGGSLERSGSVRCVHGPGVGHPACCGDYFRRVGQIVWALRVKD